uniref:ubiquitinyl hydrolase 1 n=1 Tax=Rousettus aegyptiacus TaxID=9407 RepID=A0A7J8IFW6_ROUAE|nr:ataxin 3 [Rousettus aegyptiacus]
MESIFHEKQEGSLCAQHCLNNLLQGEYFSPVELSSIAHQLDEEERMRMAEGGVTSEDYRTFLQQPSGNMDDSGFFSIQTIFFFTGYKQCLESLGFRTNPVQQSRVSEAWDRSHK